MSQIQDLNKKSKSELIEIAASYSQSNIHLSEELKLEKKKVEALYSVMHADSPHQFITSLMEGMPDWSFQAIRLVIEHEDYFQKIIKVGVGDRSEVFSYLDGQVNEQLGGKEILEISDTSRIHNFIFDPAKSYPKSIYAFPIISLEKRIGFLWMANERAHAISRDQLQRMQRIVKELSLSFTFFADIIRHDQIAAVFQMAIDAMDEPLILTDGFHNLIRMNSAAQKALQIDVGPEGKQISQELLSNFRSKDKEIIFTIDGNTFLASRREIELPGRNEEYFLLYIENISLQQKKDDYLKTVINALAENISREMEKIKGFVHLIDNLGQLSPKQGEYLNHIRVSEERIQAIVDDLLSVERLKSGSFITPVEVDLRALIIKIAAVFDPLLAQKQLSLSLDLPEEGVLIISDEGLLEMLILYIIDSSIQEAPMESVVSISLERSSELSTMMIKDRGIGLSRPDIEAIIRRTGTNVENKNLRIAKAISDLLLAEFTIESTLGEGKSIKIALPMIK